MLNIKTTIPKIQIGAVVMKKLNLTDFLAII